MPGMGDDIEGTIQQAPHWRHGIVGFMDISLKRHNSPILRTRQR